MKLMKNQQKSSPKGSGNPADPSVVKDRYPGIAQPEKLARETGAALYRYFAAVIPGDYIPDLVQEVFVRLLPKIKKKSFSDARQAHYYAYGIAKKIKLEFFKKQARARNLKDKASQNAEFFGCEMSSASEPEQKIIEKEHIAKLKAAIKKLNPAEQEVVSLLIDWDLGLGEIASLTGMPLGTVKSHIHRARVRLKQILAN